MAKKKEGGSRETLHCIGCGCDERHACAGGCSWARKDPPVCDRCAWIARRLVDWFIPNERLTVWFDPKVET